MHALPQPPLQCTDNVVHTHPLDSSELDSTLRSVSVATFETRLERCRTLLDAFCTQNNISYLVFIDNGCVDVKRYAPTGGSSVHPYGLLFISSNQTPFQTFRSEMFNALTPELNIHIVVSECRLYPSLVETVVRAYPRIRYWDAVNSSVLNPRVMAAWQSLAHLNTLKLSLLNCLEPTMCRAQLTHWPTNHIQRLLVLGGKQHECDTEFCNQIVERFQFLVYFAYTSLYIQGDASDGSLVHITSPPYTVCPKPWMRRISGLHDVAYDDETVLTVLHQEFQTLQIQQIGTQTLLAEVCV
jgi:hypothetical protein